MRRQWSPGDYKRKNHFYEMNGDVGMAGYKV